MARLQLSKRVKMVIASVCLFARYIQVVFTRSLRTNLTKGRFVLGFFVSFGCTLLVIMLLGGLDYNAVRQIDRGQPTQETTTKYITPTIETKYASAPHEVNMDQYNATLTAHASTNREIILSLVDSSFLDMTMNFYETSIWKLDISNYLFIASDKSACDVLVARGINCHVYMTDKNAKKLTVYGTHDFNQKMNIRTYMLLDALKLGFTVLHSDVDIVFMKSPLANIKASIGGANIAALWDSAVYNAGFLYLRPTNLSIEIYTKMKHLALMTKMDDQSALNKVIRDVTGSNSTLKPLIKRLNIDQYQCGKKYFEDGCRYFTGLPCPQCIVIHNNWIVSKEAKRYRFQETGLWVYDDQGYYGNESARYITYANPPVVNASLFTYANNVELAAFKTALYIGHVLHRDVILPRFHLTQHKAVNGKTKADISDRPLNSWIKISLFDDYFRRKYRESSFLLHDKVPQKIKQGISKPFWIRTFNSERLFGLKQEHVTLLEPRNRSAATTSEIRKWFGVVKAPVLRLISTSGIFGADDVPKDAKDFYAILTNAFKRSNYRQLK